MSYEPQAVEEFIFIKSFVGLKKCHFSVFFEIFGLKALAGNVLFNLMKSSQNCLKIKNI